MRTQHSRLSIRANKRSLFSLTFFSFLSLSLFVSCGGESKQSSLAPSAEVAAPKQIAESFWVGTLPSSSNGPVKTDQNRISIHTKALEKEFLLQAQLFSYAEVPMFNGLKSRIVAFRKEGDKLYMLEATQGHTLSPNNKNHIPLAEFPILEEKDDLISFDFNKGMSSIFVTSDWYAQDDQGDSYNGPQLSAVKINFSFIQKAELTEFNQLVVDQSANVILPGPGGQGEASPTRVKYYLSPYQPDAGFETTPSKNFQRMGFFEVAPKLTSVGRSLVHATKFNHKKPIMYHLSANTPKEYQEAIRDGILYWNKAFGQEVLQVAEAPADREAPDVNYNIVQWVPWDLAGFAYADAQMDPRSGEILHAQVFMTSSFAFNSRFRARQLIKTLKEQRQASHQHSHHAHHKGSKIQLAGFKLNEMCDFRLNENLISSLEHLLAHETDDQKFLKASQDYVREVVAHEIGHTLGLRHNFAGSLAINYPLQKRGEIYRTYLQSGQTPEGVVPSSSVMDYSNFVESVLAGDLINKSPKALRYDEMVIQSLYLGKKFEAKETPLFCTDSHLMKSSDEDEEEEEGEDGEKTTDSFVDCNAFDMGTGPVEYSATSVEAGNEKLTHSLIEDFIFAKAPPFGEEPTSFEEIRFSTGTMAKDFLSSRDSLLRALSKKGKVLAIHRQYPLVSSINEEEVRNQEIEYLTKELEKQGGLAKVLKGIPRNFAQVQMEKFEQILNSGIYHHGIGPNGLPYEFSAEDIASMKAIAQKIFPKLHLDLIKNDLKSLQSWTYGDHPLSSELAKIFFDRMEEYVFAQTGKFLTATIKVEIKQEDEEGEEEGEEEASEEESAETPANTTPAPEAEPSVEVKVIEIKLPLYHYPFEVRRLAANLLNKARGSTVNWGLKERNEHTTKFTEQILAGFGGLDLKHLKASDLPDPMAKWLLENATVLAIIKGE